MVTEYTIASSTAQLVNANTRKPEDALLRTRTDKKSNFGRFVYPGEKIGTLTKKYSHDRIGRYTCNCSCRAWYGFCCSFGSCNESWFCLSEQRNLVFNGVETKGWLLQRKPNLWILRMKAGGWHYPFIEKYLWMWLLERCRAAWGRTSYPELIAEGNASEPFRSLINPDDVLFANPADMEQAIKTYCSDLISLFRRHGGKLYVVSLRALLCAIVRFWIIFALFLLTR